MAELSADGGRTWREVARGGAAGDTRLPAGTLPATRAGRLRLRADDGFHVATSDPVRVVVPARAPVATILDPTRAATVDAGARLYLSGAATDGRGRPVPARGLRWRAGGRVLARGASASVLVPAGARRITLEARAGGRTGRASVAVRTRATTPFFVGLPTTVRARRGVVTLRVRATQPARLTVAGRRYAVGRRARVVRIRVRPGRSGRTLELRLTARGRTLRQTVVVQR